MSDNGIHERIEDLEILVTGNGTPERGMIVRLDRIEREMLFIRWILGVGLSVISTGICALLFK